MARHIGTANLVQYTNPSLSPEERQERARKAGIASGEARRKRRLMRDTLLDILVADIPEDETEMLKALTRAGVPATIQSAICYAAAAKAMKGDVEAGRFVRDSIGERPVDGLAIGSMEDLEMGHVDLSSLSNAQLEALIAKARRDSEEDV